MHSPAADRVEKRGSRRARAGDDDLAWPFARNSEGLLRVALDLAATESAMTAREDQTEERSDEPQAERRAVQSRHHPGLLCHRHRLGQEVFFSPLLPCPFIISLLHSSHSSHSPPPRSSHSLHSSHSSHSHSAPLCFSTPLADVSPRCALTVHLHPARFSCRCDPLHVHEQCPRCNNGSRTNQQPLWSFLGTPQLPLQLQRRILLPKATRVRVHVDNQFNIRVDSVTASHLDSWAQSGRQCRPQ